MKKNPYKSDPYDLFEFFKKEEQKKEIKELKYKEKNKEKYINEIFKLYYDLLKNYILNFPTKKSGGHKASAMASYLSIKDFIKKHFEGKCVVSGPNVFIKGNTREFDCLLLKGKSINEGFYDEKEVYAAIELKVSGFFHDKEKGFIKSFYKDLLKSETEYLNEIPFLYIAFCEGTNNSNSYYEDSYKALKKIKENKNINLFFVTVKKRGSRYTIPYDYDLEAIISKIIS